jgi:hypothetical protein
MVHDCAFVGYELSEAINNTYNDIHVEMLPYPLHTKLTVFKIAQKIRKINPEIVHAHYCRYPAYAALLSRKPYIIHCHGTDIRHGINFWQDLCLKKARQILVSTPDLLKILPNATWLPNPINMEHFRPLQEHYGNKALYFRKWYENVEDELDTICKKLGYVLRIKKKRDIPYGEMPNFLNEFDIYVDQFVGDPSKTALEAMACGLAVIGYPHDLKETLERLRDTEERRVYINKQRKSILGTHDRRYVASCLAKNYRRVYSQLQK